jgi:hypothetical protein
MIATALVVNGTKGTTIVVRQEFKAVYITGRRQEVLNEAVAKLDKIEPGSAIG